MEDWEKELRDRLDSTLENKLYRVGEGDFIAFTGKQGYIEIEVEVERTLREALTKFDKEKDNE